jgi:hypothetical protein
LCYAILLMLYRSLFLSLFPWVPQSSSTVTNMFYVRLCVWSHLGFVHMCIFNNDHFSYICWPFVCLPVRSICFSHCSKWNEPGTERQMAHDLTYIWNPKNSSS